MGDLSIPFTNFANPDYSEKEEALEIYESPSMWIVKSFLFYFIFSMDPNESESSLFLLLLIQLFNWELIDCYFYGLDISFIL